MKTFASILSSALLALHLLGCDDAAASKADDDPSSQTQSRSELQVAFAGTSVPGIDSVILTISSVRARVESGYPLPAQTINASALRSAGGPDGPTIPDPDQGETPSHQPRWYSLYEGPTTFDLSHPQNGLTHLLGQAQLPAAAYAEIEFHIESAAIVRNGQQIPVAIAPEALHGVNVLQPFSLVQDQRAQLVLAFDLNQSPELHNAQAPVLKPVVSMSLTPAAVASPHSDEAYPEPADRCSVGPRQPYEGCENAS